MHDKAFYRARLLEMKPFIKITCYCDELNIHKGNLSRFLKGPAYDDVINIKALDELYNLILSSLQSFIS